MMIGKDAIKKQWGLWGVLATCLLSCGGPSLPSLKTMRVGPPQEGLTYPVIVSSEETGKKQMTHEFEFEQHKYKIPIAIDRSIADGARMTDKSVQMTQKMSPDLWRPGLQWALMTDPAQDGMYDAVLEALGDIKAKQKLDDNRYAELLAVFVQSIEYCNVPGGPAKYPIEMMGDGCGDCDDKSRFLAALYVREGYDAVLFIFKDEQHMAVGIRTDGESFWNSGYAYIETTSPAYIGFPSYEYSDVKISSAPELLILGDQTKRWTKSDEVSFLYNTLNEQRQRATDLKEALEEAKAEKALRKAKHEQLAAKLAASKGKLDTKAYNALVEDTNDAAAEFNKGVNDYNDIVNEINQCGAIVSYIFDHPSDRQGVYQWVKEKL